MDVVNQGSVYVLGLAFTDENGNNVTPSGAQWRLDAEGIGPITGNNANAWVTFTPGGSSYNLQITGIQNAMSNNSNNREMRVVTIEFTYGAGNNAATMEYRYLLTRIENLLDVP
jgi:hypothetical protein